MIVVSKRTKADVSLLNEAENVFPAAEAFCNQLEAKTNRMAFADCYVTTKEGRQWQKWKWGKSQQTQQVLKADCSYWQARLYLAGAFLVRDVTEEGAEGFFRGEVNNSQIWNGGGRCEPDCAYCLAKARRRCRAGSLIEWRGWRGCCWRRVDTSRKTADDESWRRRKPSAASTRIS